jgi:acetyl-CoA synthetase
MGITISSAVTTTSSHPPVLRTQTNDRDRLAKEIQQHVRTRQSLHAYPREIAFVDELPKTPSGKVQRFLLRRM